MSSPNDEISTGCVGVLTVSDRASRGEYVDKGGPEVCKYVVSHFTGPPALKTCIVPDEEDSITEAIVRLSSTCDLVLTTGGTGPAPRDVTPEATEKACKKMLPGFGERMRTATVEQVPTAILSRQTAGICGKSLVINLPGSVKAIAECLDTVLPAIPHAVRLAGAPGTLKLSQEFHKPCTSCPGCSTTN